ncbi:MAG: hypothetical protein J6332_07525, partial [Abditibacteriota bacterium]|nr:hypothetical protein [Abditibacteriota bacterium]
MKKILVFIAVLCAICGSAFAEVIISDWCVSDGYINPVIYDGLITDIAPAGFSVTANSEMWDEENRPMAEFLSETVSPGWNPFVNIVTNDATTFQVRITGFDDLVVKPDQGTPFPGTATILIRIFEAPYNGNAIFYQTPWKGNGVYTLGFDEQIR